jgi:hypothetical protein
MLTVEMDEVLNQPIFSAPGVNMSQPTTFGVIQTDTGNSRGGKVSLRLKF